MIKCKFINKSTAIWIAIMILLTMLPVSSVFAVTKTVTVDAKLSEDCVPYLEWNPVRGCDWYHVYRAKEVNGQAGQFTQWTIRYIHDDNGNIFEDYEAAIGKNYYYKVLAYNDNDVLVAESSTYKLCPTLIKPVIHNTYHDAETGRPVIEWSYTTNADRYQIWRSKSKAGTYSKIYTTTKQKYTDKETSTGTTYYYKIKAVCDSSSKGNSTYSSIKSVKKVKGDSSLASAIKKTEKNGVAAKVSTLEDTLSLVSELSISALVGFDGGIYQYAEDHLSFSQIASFPLIKKAGGSVKGTDSSRGDPFMGAMAVYVQKNKIKYNPFEYRTYGVNILKVAKGSTQSEIINLIEDTAKDYYSTKKWKINAEKYKSSKTYTKEVKELKTPYNDYLAESGYKKYQSNKYYLTIKSKSNVKKKGWTFVTAVPTLSKRSTPAITVKSLSSSKNIKVSWKKVSKADEYEVWRKIGKNGSYKKVKTTTSVSYTDKNTKIGKKYYYKVKAIETSNSTQNSKFSKVKSLTCK